MHLRVITPDPNVKKFAYYVFSSNYMKNLLRARASIIIIQLSTMLRTCFYLVSNVNPEYLLELTKGVHKLIRPNS